MKHIIIAALLILVWDRPADAGPLRWAALGSIGADLGSTAIALNRCDRCREGHPFGVAGVTVASGATWLSIWRLEKDHPKLSKWLYVSMIGVRGFVTVHNLRVSR